MCLTIDLCFTDLEIVGPNWFSLSLNGEEDNEMICSVSSYPTANYTWTRNYTVVDESSDKLALRGRKDGNGESEIIICTAQVQGGRPISDTSSIFLVLLYGRQ